VAKFFNFKVRYYTFKVVGLVLKHVFVGKGALAQIGKALMQSNRSLEMELLS